MHFLGTIILPKTYKGHKITIKTSSDVIEKCIDAQLKKYEYTDTTKEHPVQCCCKIISAQNKTMSFFKDQISKLYLDWESLKHKDQFGSNILKLDVNLAKTIKFYYKQAVHQSHPDLNCVNCLGLGHYMDFCNPNFRYHWKTIGGLYNGIWKKMEQYDDLLNNILPVHKVPVASNVLILPSKKWVEKPEDSLIDFSFKSMTSKEWTDFFFKTIKPLNSHVAVAIDFYRED